MEMRGAVHGGKTFSGAEVRSVTACIQTQSQTETLLC